MNHSFLTADAATFRKIFVMAIVAATIVVALGVTEREAPDQSTANGVSSAASAKILVVRQPAIIVSSLD